MGVQQHVLGAPQKPRLHQHGTYFQPVVAHGSPCPAVRAKRSVTFAMHDEVLSETVFEILCVRIRLTAAPRDGPAPRDPVKVLRPCPHGHPFMEASRRIIFIVLVKAGSSRQKSFSLPRRSVLSSFDFRVCPCLKKTLMQVTGLGAFELKPFNFQLLFV